MMKKILPLVLLCVSMSSVAGEFTVTKSDRPNNIIGTAKSVSMHRLMGTDYPVPRAGKLFRLTRVDYTTTVYPQSVGQKSELCLMRNSVETRCFPISSGGGEPLEFGDSLGLWGYVDYIKIKHSHESGPLPSKPMGNDTVTFHITY